MRKAFRKMQPDAAQSQYEQHEADTVAEALERAIDAGKDCAGVLHQIAGVRNRGARELIEILRTCLNNAAHRWSAEAMECGGMVA